MEQEPRKTDEELLWLKSSGPPQGGDAPSINQRRDPLGPPLRDRISTEERLRVSVLVYINEVRVAASRQRTIQHLFQVVIIVGAAFVTVLVGLSEIPKWIPAILSGIVSAATGLVSYFRFGERSRVLTETADALEREYELFKRQQGPYRERDQEAAAELLRDQIDYLKRIHAQKLHKLETLSENQPTPLSYSK